MSSPKAEPTTKVIDDLIELERRIEASASSTESALPSTLPPQAASLFTQLHTTSQKHQEDLQHQRKGMAAGALTAELPASRSVGKLYAELCEASIAYADLHARAHRDFDSRGEGNTATLAESHLRTYAAAIRQLNLLVSDIVVRELADASIDCRCQCPACGFGLCLCSPHGSSTVQDIVLKAVLEPQEAGLRVRRPKAGSEAERAGLVDGDILVAIDGTEIATDLDIGTVQDAIQAHASGDALRLRVARSAGEQVELTAHRP